MIRTLNNVIFSILMLVVLSGCGSSSSSPTITTIPSSATIFYAHNLVFRNSTTLSTGYNGFGQLASGNLDYRTALGYLWKYDPYKGFATGGDHSVAFMNNSTVRSWGYNGFGQLGDSTTTYSVIPVKTVGISGVRAVAAGAYHSLALNKDANNNDTIWAWGSNGAGQLGIDSLFIGLGYSAVPRRVNGGGIVFSNISSIAANGYNSMALADGKVWVWGLNGSGQLGLNPADTGALATPIPVYIPTSFRISGIAAGGAFSYAFDKDGTLWSWGCNDTGQLGNGSTVSSYLPVKVMTSAGNPLANVVQVAAGIQHGLARLSDGTVWAWGFNFFGQLGNNGALDSTYAVQVVMDTAGTKMTNATDIKAFGSSSMALINGAWYAWGNNSFGQLGIGLNGTQATIVPIPVKLLGF